MGPEPDMLAMAKAPAHTAVERVMFVIIFKH
jgi:hypothetical protein